MLDEFDAVLHKAKEGNESSWRLIHNDLDDTLVGYLRVQGGSDPDALAADVWLSVARSIDTFAGAYEKFRSWVFTIAHNRLIDDRRRTSRRRGEISVEEVPEPVGGDVESDAMREMGTDWVQQALDVLTADQAEVIGLRILAGFTVGQIADITGKRPGAVKAAQRRGLKRIADWHAYHPYPPADDERLLQ